MSTDQKKMQKQNTANLEEVNSLANDSLNLKLSINKRLESSLKLISILSCFSYKTKLDLSPNKVSKLVYAFEELIASKPLLVDYQEILALGKHLLNEISANKMSSYTTKKNIDISFFSLSGCKQDFQISEEDLLYPRIVQIESKAICNAKCSFCDYDDLIRKGTIMSTEMIDKILNELTEIPSERTFVVEPYKISEPFLEERLGTICKKVIDMHQNSRVSINSNANFIREKTLEEIISLTRQDNFYIKSGTFVVPRLSISFSLNESDQKDYERLMKLSFKKTISNLDKIHSLVEKKELPSIIKITRVSTNATKDLKFKSLVKSRYPLFRFGLFKLNDWIGTNEFSSESIRSDGFPYLSYQKLGCRRWFDLDIMANGKVAICCMDSGVRDYNIGNAFSENILDIYRRKVRLYLPNDLKRGSAKPPCNGCTYFQGPMKTLKSSKISYVLQRKNT